LQNINKLLSLSELAFSQQQFEKASEYLSLAFNQDLVDLETYMGKLYQMQGRIFSKKGQYNSDKTLLNKAIENFNKAKENLPNDSLSNTKIGEILIFLKDFSNAETILENALISSRENKQVNNEIAALINLVRLNIENRQLDKAIKLSESILLTESTPDILKIEYHLLLMTINIRTHTFDKVEEFAKKCIALCKKTYNKEGEIQTLNAKGIVYAIKGEYKQAFESFWSAHDKSIEIGYRLMTARALINIGNIFSSLYNYKEARKRHSKVINEYLDQIDTYTYIILCHNLGGTNYELGNNEEALKYYLKGFETAKAENIYRLQAILLYEVSKIYAEFDLEKAMYYVNETEIVLENHNINSGVEINVINLAEIYFKQEKYEAALNTGLKSLELCKNIKNNKTLTRVYLLLSKAYKVSGDFEKSLNFHESYHALQAELHQEMRKRQTLELEIRYDLKEKENEIKLLKTDMELQRVELEYANEIAEQSELLKQVNEEIKQFTYAVSHDLKEPLRMIGSFTGLISRKLKKVEDESVHEYMGFVTDGVVRMTAMLNGMLDYARVGKNSYQNTTVNLMQTISDVILTLRVSIQENNANITFDEMPIIETNKILINQLFQNLIGNAIKFRKKDIAPNIHVSGKDEKDQFVFTIKDNGIGIATDKKLKVFDLFTRLHTKEEYEGTGIGLAMCKKIIQILHGDIWLESEFGVGTTFYFTIPKSTEPVVNP
jgi:signal transduction histidine kinase